MYSRCAARDKIKSTMPIKALSIQTVEKVQFLLGFFCVCGIIKLVIKMIVKDRIHRDQLEMFSIEEFVPADHLLRKIDMAVDFIHIYDLVEDLYCKDNGRPSIDPVVIFKTVLIQHIYGIPSLRRTVEDIRYTPEYKELYERRKETIERVFADAKEKYAMRYTPYRGLSQVTNWVRLKFAAMNLKSMCCIGGKGITDTVL